MEESVRTSCGDSASDGSDTLRKLSTVCTLLLLPEAGTSTSSAPQEAEPPLASAPIPALASFLSEVLALLLCSIDNFTDEEAAWTLIHTCLRVWQAALARVRVGRSSFDAFVERLFPCVAAVAYKATAGKENGPLSSTKGARTTPHRSSVKSLAWSVMRQSLFGGPLVRDFPAAFSDSVVHTQLALVESEKSRGGSGTDAPAAKRHHTDSRSESLYDPPVSSFHRRLWESLRRGTDSSSSVHETDSSVHETALPRDLCRQALLTAVPSLLEEFIRAWEKAPTTTNAAGAGAGASHTDSRRRKKRRRELRDAEVGVEESSMTAVAVDTVGASVFVPPPALGFALELVLATCPSLRAPVEEARKTKTRSPQPTDATMGAAVCPEEWAMLQRWLHVVRSHKLYRPQDDVAPHPQQHALRRVVARVLAVPADDGSNVVMPAKSATPPAVVAAAWCGAIANATTISHRLVEPHFRAILAYLPLLLSRVTSDVPAAAEETALQLLKTWQSLRQAPEFVASVMESLDALVRRADDDDDDDDDDSTGAGAVDMARSLWLSPRIRHAWRDAVCKAPEGQLGDTLLPPLRCITMALEHHSGDASVAEPARGGRDTKRHSGGARAKRPRDSAVDDKHEATISGNKSIVLEIAAYWFADGMRMTPVRPSNAATILQRAVFVAQHVAKPYLQWALRCSNNKTTRQALLSAGWALVAASVDAASATQPFLLARTPLGIGSLLQTWEEDDSVEAPVSATWAAAGGDSLKESVGVDRVIADLLSTVEGARRKEDDSRTWDSVVEDTLASLEQWTDSDVPLNAMSLTCHVAESVATSLAQRFRLWMAAVRSHLSRPDTADAQHGETVANALLRLLRIGAGKAGMHELRRSVFARVEAVLPLAAQTASPAQLAETLVAHPDLWDAQWLLDAVNDAELLEGVDNNGLRQRLAESLVRLIARRILAAKDGVVRAKPLQSQLRKLSDPSVAIDASALASLSSAVEPLWCETAESTVTSDAEATGARLGPMVEELAKSSGYLWTFPKSADSHSEEPSCSGHALLWLVLGCITESPSRASALPFWRALDHLLHHVPQLLLQQSGPTLHAFGVRLASWAQHYQEQQWTSPKDACEVARHPTATIQWAARVLTAADARKGSGGATVARMRSFGEGVRLGAGNAMDVWLAALWGALRTLSPSAGTNVAQAAAVGLTHKSGKLRSWATPDQRVEDLVVDKDRPVNAGVVWLAAADLQCQARLGKRLDGALLEDAPQTFSASAHSALGLLARAAASSETSVRPPFHFAAALLDSVIGRGVDSSGEESASSIRTEWATLCLQWLAREVALGAPMSTDARPMETALQRWMLTGSRAWVEALLRHVEAQLTLCGTEQWDHDTSRDHIVAACARTVRVFLETAPSAKPSGVKGLLSHWALALLVSGRAAMSSSSSSSSPVLSSADVLCDWLSGAASVLARPRLLPMTARDVAAVLGWLDPLVRAAAERGAGLPGQWRAKSGVAGRRKETRASSLAAAEKDHGVAIAATAGAQVVYTLVRHRRMLVTPLAGTLTSILVSLTALVLDHVATRPPSTVTPPPSSSSSLASPSSSVDENETMSMVRAPVDSLVRVWQETARVFRSKTAVSATEAAQAKSQGPAVGVRGGRKWIARAACRSVGRILLGEWAHRSGSLLRAGLAMRDKLRPGLFALFSMVTEQDVQDLYVHLQGLPHAQAALQETHRLWEEEHEAEIMAGKDI